MWWRIILLFRNLMEIPGLDTVRKHFNMWPGTRESCTELLRSAGTDHLPEMFSPGMATFLESLPAEHRSLFLETQTTRSSGSPGQSYFTGKYMIWRKAFI